MLTNSFVPCNGRFPTLTAMVAMFLAAGLPYPSVSAALFMTGAVLLGVLATFGISRLLSQTLLRGVPSSFALELPPYRRPQLGRVLVRSLLDRTLFVLRRAAAVAAPAGLVIWLMANIRLGEGTLLTHCAGFLDPFGRLLGLDGVILLAFILGFPANEIVIPILLMAYTASGSLVEYESLSSLRELLTGQGWTWATGVSMILLCLFHWPCSTTCLTIRKESGSWKWTACAFLLPTLTGILACFLFTSVVRLCGLV